MIKRTLCILLALMMVLSAVPMQAMADGLAANAAQTINGIPAEEYMVTYLGDVPTYTGSPVEPEAVVSCRNETLTVDVDYTVAYENNVNATDEAYIVITGCGDYEGLSLRQPFTIAPYDLGTLGIWAMEIPYADPLVYPEPVVDDNGNVLEEGVDYLFRQKAVAYGDTVSHGCIYGIGNYTGAQSMMLTITYPNGGAGGGSDPEIPEGEVHTYYPADGDEDIITISTPDSLRLLVQTEESKFFTASYGLYYFESENDTDPELVTEVRYSDADVNTVNDFEYQFLSPGIYGLAAAWAEYTKDSYIGSDGQVVYTQEPNGITGTYAAVIEVTGVDYGTGTGGGEEIPMGTREERYGWIESVEPKITYVSPRRILLEHAAAPGGAIIADYYDYSKYVGNPDPLMTYDYIYLRDAGSYTFYAKTYEQDDGSYKFSVKWKIDVPEWDILDGGRIETCNIGSREVQVTFGGEVLDPKTDYDVSVANVKGTGLVKVTVTCKKLFRGTLSKLYYADTGNPYYCEHTYESAVTEPTCTEGGYTVHTCSYCGHACKDSLTEALGHAWTGTGCTRCGAVRENPFTDVPEGSFYIDPVLWAVENGVTTGASDTTFNPTGTCKRAQVVTFLWRAAGSPEPTSTNNPFTDVKESDYFYKAVLWAVEKGITTGTSATTFNPTGTCKRAQVVTFLWRSAGSPDATATGNLFPDVERTAYYGKAVLWAVENGITNGMSDGTFGVSENCSRAQVVTFLYRTYVN